MYDCQLCSSDLITLCKTCHENYHKGKIKLKQTRAEKYNDATFMGIMRWSFYNELKEIYPDVSLTYGYITKSNRIKYNLAKEHYNDAYCIAQNFKAEPLDKVISSKKVHCNNTPSHYINVNKPIDSYVSPLH